MNNLERLKELDAKASPGPWAMFYDGSGDYYIMAGEKEVGSIWSPNSHFMGLGKEAEINEVNTELIALLRNNLPALLDVVEGSKDYLTTLKALTPIVDKEQIAQAVEVLSKKAKTLSNNIAKLESSDA